MNRHDLRLAVGHLFGYDRFAESNMLAVLVPERPSPDLISYLMGAHVGVIYQNAATWTRVKP